jgi:hypothetical protein
MIPDLIFSFIFPKGFLWLPLLKQPNSQETKQNNHLEMLVVAAFSIQRLAR